MADREEKKMIRILLFFGGSKSYYEKREKNLDTI